MIQNSVKRKLAQGQRTWGTSLVECLDPEMTSLLKAAGLDFFFVDTEHSPADYAQIQALCRTARSAGVIPMVRVTDNQPYLISRALDVGAMGVIVPRVHSADSARNAVRAAKFPPDGQRGFGLRAIITDYETRAAAESIAECNQETMVVVQIESAQGLDEVEAIASVPGLDALFIGPYDLTLSLGFVEQFGDPRFWSAVERVIEAGCRNGVAVGLQTANIELLQECARRGLTFLLYANDTQVLLEGYRRAMAELRDSLAPNTVNR
jgi:2-keto-3-deoxy-L-rhamnonate aldolase RhmA